MDPYYVEPDYVDVDYLSISGLDGDPPEDSELGRQKPAGGGSRNRRQRKRYHIDGRIYWATESELPGLVAAILQQPPKVAKTVAKAAKQPSKARAVAAEVKIATPHPVLVEARLERMEAQFRLMDDEVLLRSLEIARRRLRDMDEDDIEMLLLA